MLVTNNKWCKRSEVEVENEVHELNKDKELDEMLKTETSKKTYEMWYWTLFINSNVQI